VSTILAADDDAASRALLVELLSYAGHTVLEAHNGLEALELVQLRHPDLVIADLLMPTMDGFEFVQRVRGDPSTSTTPVIFSTAIYKQDEARELASRCGVIQVLPKPSEPETLLQAVDNALGSAPRYLAGDIPPEFERQHLRLVSDRLLRSATEYEALNARLSALIRLALRLASEAEPQQLLDHACQAAREIIGAELASVQLEIAADDRAKHLVVSGDLAGGPESGAETVDRLRAPVLSPARTYGWIELQHKRSGGFSSEDQRLLSLLAAQLALAYENAQRYAAMLAQAEALRARAEEFQALVENASDLIMRFDADLRHVYVSPSVEKLSGRAVETFIGKTNRELDMPDPPLAAWELTLGRAFRTGHEQTVELTLPTRLGERHYIARITPEFGLDRKIRTVLAINRDITERKEAEAERATLYRELAEREERLQDLVGHLITQHETEMQRAGDAARIAYLTSREREIVQLLVKGLTNREIALRMHLAPGTVKNHVARLLPKLHATDRTHAAVRAVELGLTSVEVGS